MSLADATAFVEMFAGCIVYISSKPRPSKHLIISILFMQGFVTAEIASACQVTQAYVFQAQKKLLEKYPELTVFKECRRLKRANVPDAPKHCRWTSVYRRSRYKEFIQQVNGIDTLREQAKVAFEHIARIRNCLPEDPCIPPVVKPWKKRTASENTTVSEAQA